MKASELRIGNLIYKDIIHMDTSVTKDVWKVSALDIRDCDHYKDDFNGEPIPLTEEWLIRFGATKHSSINYKLMVGALPMSLRISPGSNCYSELGEIYLGQHITHVHQLQNLYFALTGEELQLK